VAILFGLPVLYLRLNKYKHRKNNRLFWDVTSYSLVGTSLYHYGGETGCLSLQVGGLKVDAEYSLRFRQFIPNCMASCAY